MKIKHILDIGSKIGLRKKECELYGDFKAKVNLSVLERVKGNKSGKLIFVTSITPTPAGEGKTTTSIGLLDALGFLGKKALLCLRQPSLGPVFGIKGGATGAGKAKLYPAEDINLHFTGDSYAIATAHNLLAAVVDNHIYWGNKLKIDREKILWGRVLDISDRTLRKIQIGLNIKKLDYPRRSNFYITSASEITAILALFEKRNEFRKMLSKIIVAYNEDNLPVYARDLKVVPSLLLLLKDAIKPNLVQTLNANPVFIHTGPFANIASGNSSLIATKIALKLSDYVVTEGGFGSDLGLEKFVHIVARKAHFKISVVVIVVSIRALKYQAGVDIKDSRRLNISALERGLANLKHHIGIIKKFGLESVVCINRFPWDNKKELNFLKKYCCEILNLDVAVSEVYKKGPEGGIELAQKVLSKIVSGKSNLKYLYSLKDGVRKKIEIIAREVYGAKGVTYSALAREKIEALEHSEFASLALSMAKTQFSLTHNSKIRGVPSNWDLMLRDLLVSNGAGFIVPLTGKMLLLPGLPARPRLEKIKYRNDKFEGLD